MTAAKKAHQLGSARENPPAGQTRTILEMTAYREDFIVQHKTIYYLFRLNLLTKCVTLHISVVVQNDLLHLFFWPRPYEKMSSLRGPMDTANTYI